jgi:hypothetical protein
VRRRIVKIVVAVQEILLAIENELDRMGFVVVVILFFLVVCNRKSNSRSTVDDGFLLLQLFLERKSCRRRNRDNLGSLGLARSTRLLFLGSHRNRNKSGLYGSRSDNSLYGSRSGLIRSSLGLARSTRLLFLGSHRLRNGSRSVNNLSSSSSSSRKRSRIDFGDQRNRSGLIGRSLGLARSTRLLFLGSHRLRNGSRSENRLNRIGGSNKLANEIVGSIIVNTNSLLGTRLLDLGGRRLRSIIRRRISSSSVRSSLGLARSTRLLFLDRLVALRDELAHDLGRIAGLIEKVLEIHSLIFNGREEPELRVCLFERFIREEARSMEVLHKLEAKYQELLQLGGKCRLLDTNGLLNSGDNNVGKIGRHGYRRGFENTNRLLL